MEKRIILLADDDSDDAEMFCEALSNIDSNIICKCRINGLEALKTLNEEKELPELIFLDLNMPIMNGWECMKVLKNDVRYKDIPIIMISTSSHTRDVEMATEQGALGYLVKPTNFNDLERILKTITINIGTNLKNALLTLQANSLGLFFASKGSD